MTREEFLSIEHPSIEEYRYSDVVVYFLWNKPSKSSITLKGSVWIYTDGNKSIALKNEVLKELKDLEAAAFSIRKKNLILLNPGKKYVIGRLFGEKVRQE